VNDIAYIPEFSGQRYYDTHYKFIIELLKAANIEVKLYHDKRKGRGFVMHYKDKSILIDFGDHLNIADDYSKYDAQFRFHYSYKRHKGLKNTFPLTPISFYNWDEYFNLQKTLRYNANGMILSNQRPGAAALKRRKLVQYRLKEWYGGQVDTSFTGRKAFWKKVNKCLVSVCVPGARNDILDRGQLQYMAFGACTVSPPLDVVLPYWTELKPDEHYIACREDYSDVLNVIEDCIHNREKCIKIGTQAKQAFLNYCTPGKVIEWLNHCLENLE